MRCVALIPARGGSKGIPGKNLRWLGGETLLARAIRKCREASKIDVICVSTEDDDIAEEAAASGATVIWRPLELAQDDSHRDPVIAHAIGQIDSDVVAFVQCTSPFMSVEEIDGTIQRLYETGADGAVAVAPTDALLVTEYRDRAEAVNWEMVAPIKRRQDRAEYYEVCGSVWAFWVDRFLERGSLDSGDYAIYKAGKRFELDEPIDLQWAEAIDKLT